jgi:hypothetical protein
VPHLTPTELDLLHRMWLDFSNEVAPEELHHRDVVHFALNELLQQKKAGKRQEIVDRLREHIQQIKDRRPHTL